MKKEGNPCVSCGHQKTDVETATRSFGKGDNLVIIENVPMVFCPNCEITYMTSDTMETVDNIRQSRNEAMMRLVPVAQFN